MTAPDRIWHEIVTAKDMDELYGFGISPDDWNAANFAEYARVTPDTITLPLAEVKALMEAAEQLRLFSEGYSGKRVEKINKESDAAIAAIQEKLK